MAITLPADVRARVVNALAAHFREHFEIELGILQSERLLEFLVATIGAAGYNQAVRDAQAYMQSRVLDLEGDLHEPVEWGEGGGRSP